MKKILLILSLALIIPCCAVGSDIDALLDETAAYVYKNTPSPSLGSVGGEWAILGLSRSGCQVPEKYFEDYYNSVCSYVTEHDGVLSNNKYTEYSRVIVALTAIGKNPEDTAGFNLLTPLGDYEKTTAQGLNGAVWALIALDCGGYKIPENPLAKTQATRSMYIKCILDRQLSDGGWAINRAAAKSDTDITAMALCALAKYRTRKDVSSAIGRGLDFLSATRSNDGEQTDNAEACAQVTVALAELGISLDDERFIKNGIAPIDMLLDYRLPGGGFSHNGIMADPMSTEQALYALAAAKRAASRMSTLYSISGQDPKHEAYLRSYTTSNLIK